MIPKTNLMPGEVPKAEASYLLVSLDGGVLQALGGFGHGLSLPQVGTPLDESFAFLLDYLAADAPLHLPKIQLEQDHYFDVHVLPVPEASWVVFLDVTSEVRGLVDLLSTSIVKMRDVL